VDLRVNSNTVARVYSELERAGVLETRRSRGTFVRERPEVRSESVRARRLLSLVRAFATRCGEEGYSLVEVAAALTEVSRAAGDKRNDDP
jgi:GntR family transcriptional regulator